MSSEIVRNQTPEERELERKKAELASLEPDLIQRELDLATLKAELAAFEGRYLRRVGVLYAELQCPCQTCVTCLSLLLSSL